MHAVLGFLPGFVLIVLAYSFPLNRLEAVEMELTRDEVYDLLDQVKRQLLVEADSYIDLGKKWQRKAVREEDMKEAPRIRAYYEVAELRRRQVMALEYAVEMLRRYGM